MFDVWLTDDARGGRFRLALRDRRHPIGDSFAHVGHWRHRRTVRVTARLGAHRWRLDRGAVDVRRSRVDRDEFLAEVGASGRTVGWVARQRLVDQVDESEWKGRTKMCEVGRIALESSERGLGVVISEERHPTGEALVEHQAE